MRKKEVVAGDFPKQCYLCMFVWPSSPTSIKYNIQYIVQHGVVRLCGYCVYCEAEMAAGRVSAAADIGHYSTNTKHQTQYSGHLDPENTLQSPTFSAAINEERTSLGASG